MTNRDPLARLCKILPVLALLGLGNLLGLGKVWAEEGDGETAERDLRPASERFALETTYAIGRWVLDFTYDTPASVVVERADGTREVVYYMTYSVRNPTKRRVPLRLSLQLATDVLRGAEKDRHPLVYLDGADGEAELMIEAKVGEVENSATEMRGKKRVGEGGEGGEGGDDGDAEEEEDESGEGIKPIYTLSYIEPGELRKGVAIFGVVDPNADTFVISVKGLMDPLKHERKEIFAEMQSFVITYNRPGDAFERQLDTLVKAKDEWVVTSKTKIRDRRR